ncbi:MAG TPA: NAD(P)-binding domain-containing protein, partial [Bryobacteraceae bacterium]|nr:NAD(P)-binding domain-containing protein [Bryobacteraceae bacterium]
KARATIREQLLKIGILGTGDVGRALGNAFIALGHEVKMGSRDAHNEKAVAWASTAGINASTGTFADTATFADVIVLALLWSGAENALKLAGPESFSGKVVIDAINPLLFEPGKPLALAVGHTDSAGERVQRWLPSAHVVKAFNSVGYAHMFKPDFPGGPPDMFIAGNDAAAKRTVTGILTDFGWSTIDVGGIEGSRLLEPLCILWVGYGMRTGTWSHAFKLLRK